MHKKTGFFVHVKPGKQAQMTTDQQPHVVVGFRLSMPPVAMDRHAALAMTVQAR
jgi:hypothetical protein